MSLHAIANFRRTLLLPQFFAVALVAESALELLDGQLHAPRTKSWVRGYSYLNAQYAGLTLRDWAAKAGEFDGVIIERKWDE